MIVRLLDGARTMKETHNNDFRTTPERRPDDSRMPPERFRTIPNELLDLKFEKR